MIKLILINLNISLNSQWLVATVLESTVLYSCKGQMGEVFKSMSGTQLSINVSYCYFSACHITKQNKTGMQV